MRLRALLLASALVPAGSMAALAAPCTVPTVDNTGIAIAPDGRSASVFFDDFEVGILGNPPTTTAVSSASCAFTIPFENSGYRVFKADITGFAVVNEDQSASLTEDGPLIEVEGPFDDAIIADDVARYGVGPSQGLDIDYALDMARAPTGDEIVRIETLDLLQIAEISEEELQRSLDGMARDAAATITHLGGSADLLLGGLTALEGDDEFTAVAAAGSFLIGGHGRYNLGGGLSVVGGAAFFQQDAGTSAGGLLLATGLRYVGPRGDSVRFFGEAGVWGSPNLSMGFARSYLNGGGYGIDPSTVSATSTATGMLVTGYGKAGVLLDFDEANQIALFGSVSAGVFGFGAFGETAGDDNIFAVGSAGGTQGLASAKIGATWTARPSEDFEVAATAAVGATFGGDLALDVAYAGAQTARTGPLLFVEGGIRAAYSVTDQVKLHGFVLATAGPQIGAHAQFGGGVSVKF